MMDATVVTENWPLDIARLAEVLGYQSSAWRRHLKGARQACVGENAMSDPTKVLLYEIGGLALIVPASTGIVYRNQTGGHACLPSQMEGYLVPLAGEMHEKCERLLSHFAGPKWGGWCSERIDGETADEIDSVLADILRGDQIVVDRTRLDMSWEAWVHVKIISALVSLVEHADPEEAILTWPNSD